MKKILIKVVYYFLNLSLIISNKERSEKALKNKLSKIIPDLVDQYTTFSINMNDTFLVNKVRGQHAFQISIVLRAVNLLKNKKKDNFINIIDIGDSSGTHLLYLKNLLKSKNMRSLSVNIDQLAIDRIKARGLEAILCKAEEIHLRKEIIKPDIFLLFETLEHLFNPIEFLHNIAVNSPCQYFAITVPYVHKSRVGLHHIRKNYQRDVFAENTHIFELSPDDWNLLFLFSGWEIVFSDRYTQYPKGFPLNLTKYFWRKIDFDGFYGVILRKKLKISEYYKDW